MEGGPYGGHRLDYSKNRNTVLFSRIDKVLWCEESRAINARKIYRILISSIGDNVKDNN
jgi:hypothetical protein